MTPITAFSQFGLRAETHVDIPLAGEGAQSLVVKLGPLATSHRPRRHARQQSRLSAPGEELGHASLVQHVTQMVGGDVGVGSRAMRRQSQFMDETFGHT